MPYQQLPGYVPPTEDLEEDEEQSSPNITHGTRLWSIISIILSSLGVLFVALPAVGIILGILGVCFSVYSRRKNGYFYGTAVAGIIIGAIAVASCAFFLIFNAMADAGLVINFFDALLK